MNAGQLKEYLKQVDDDAEIFCAGMIELKNIETGDAVYAVNSRQAFLVQKIVPSVRYVHGEAESSVVLGIHPVARDLHERETNIMELEIEQ